MTRLTPEEIGWLHEQFAEMMGSKGQPDHEEHLENYQCLVLNLAPKLIAAAESGARLREVYEAAKELADHRRRIGAPLGKLEATLYAAVDALAEPTDVAQEVKS